MFKPNDIVVRKEFNNGARGAKIGQEALVISVDDSGFLLVVYPGHNPNTDGCEMWCPAFAKKVVK